MMNHLKAFHLFENKADLLFTLRDISMDLVDNGFLVNISSNGSYLVEVIILKDRGYSKSYEMDKIYNNRFINMKDFSFKDVSPCIKHMASYMKSIGYRIDNHVGDYTYISVGMNMGNMPLVIHVKKEELLNDYIEYKENVNIKCVTIKFRK